MKNTALLEMASDLINRSDQIGIISDVKCQLENKILIQLHISKAK